MKFWYGHNRPSAVPDTRYPGFDNPVTKDEYENAILQAHMILRWAEEQIE